MFWVRAVRSAPHRRFNRGACQSLQLNLKNAEAHQLLGRNLMMIGRYDAAQTELEQA
jgi:hypothetical protein